MPVPSTVADLSITPASNSPPGSEAVTSGQGPDEYIRQLAAIIRREQAQGASVASAGAMTLGATTDGSYTHITGITTINTLGPIAAGIERTVVFDGILTLKHSASLIIPSGADITTAVNDVAVFRSEGSNVWRCTSYVKANGQAIVSGSYQPLDNELTALATATAAANKLPMFSGTTTATTLDYNASTTLTASTTTVPSQTAVKNYADGVASTAQSNAIAASAIAAQVVPSTAGKFLRSNGLGAWVSEAVSFGLTYGSPITLSATPTQVNGIPSTATKVVIFFEAATHNNTDLAIKLGAGTTPESTGYVSSSYDVVNSTTKYSTTSFGLKCNLLIGLYGYLTLEKRGSTNDWYISGVMGSDVGASLSILAGRKTVSGTLGCISFAPDTGSFSGGSILIAYL